MKYIKKIYTSLLLYVVFLIIQPICTILAFIIRAVISKNFLNNLENSIMLLNKYGYDEVSGIESLLANTQPLIKLMSLATIILICFLSSKKSNNKLTIKPINKYRVPDYILIGLLLNLVTTLLLDYIFGVEASSTTQGELSKYPSNMLLAIISIGVFGPIYEELAFRYLIYNKLKEETNTKVGVILTSVLFGLAHLNLIQCIYATVFGILFQLFDIKESNILPSIIIHTTINTVSLILLFTVKNKHSEYLILTIASIASIAMFIVCKLLNERKPRNG